MAGICPEDIGLEDAAKLFVIVNKFGSKEFINQLMYQHKNKLSNILSLKDVECGNNNDSFIQVENLYQSFWEAEIKLWKRGIRQYTVNSPVSSSGPEPLSLTASYSSSSSSVASVDGNEDEKSIINAWIGERFLLHGNYIKEIHSVFGEVNPKICGFNVKTVDGAPRKVSKHFKHLRDRRVSDVSVIGRSDIDEFRKRQKTLSRLTATEESTYRHALQCALNTSLICVAKAPSPTPLPRDEINPVRLQQQQSGLGDDVDNFVVGDVGSITSNTHMLVAKLKRSFGINSYLHGNLMSSIRSIRKPENFDDKETLAADLTTLRTHIANNQLTIPRPQDDPLPEYSASSFSSFEMYSIWKKRQLALVGELISTWCPEYANLEVRKPFRFDAFAEYKYFLQKLLKYDLDEKNSMARGMSNIRNFILNSDSQCLLKEFSLRYGVTESYQHLAYLECLIENFQHSDWFLGCVDQVLSDVCKYIAHEKEFIVNKEWGLTLAIIKCLQENIKYCLSKIFSIFKRTVFVKGVNYMVLILHKCVKLRNDYQLWETFGERNLDAFLIDFFKEAALSHYAEQKEFVHLKHKLYYEEEADEESDINATKLRLIQQSMKQNLGILDDLCKQCPSLQKRAEYFTRVVGKTFYSEYQKDIVQLCSIAPLDLNEVDSQMIGLAHRINTLDKDWKDFIEPSEQKWRTHFGIILATGLTVLEEYWKKEIPKMILMDDMQILDLKEHQPPEIPKGIVPAAAAATTSTVQLPTTPLQQSPSSILSVPSFVGCASTANTSSFSHSVGSAFTRVDTIKRIREDLRKGSVISIRGLVAVPDVSSSVDSSSESGSETSSIATVSDLEDSGDDHGSIGDTPTDVDNYDIVDSEDAKTDNRGSHFNGDNGEPNVTGNGIGPNVNENGWEPSGNDRESDLNGDNIEPIVVGNDRGLNGIDQESDLNGDNMEPLVVGNDREPNVNERGKRPNGIDQEFDLNRDNIEPCVNVDNEEPIVVENDKEPNVNENNMGPNVNESEGGPNVNEDYRGSNVNRDNGNDRGPIENGNEKGPFVTENDRVPNEYGDKTEPNVNKNDMGLNVNKSEEGPNVNEDYKGPNADEIGRGPNINGHNMEPNIISGFRADAFESKQLEENGIDDHHRNGTLVEILASTDSIDDDHSDEIQSLTNIPSSSSNHPGSNQPVFTFVRYPSNGPHDSPELDATPAGGTVNRIPTVFVPATEENVVNNHASVRPRIVRQETTIKDNYIKPGFILDGDIELPAKGTVMTTHSLSDLLTICARIASFTQEISDLVLPTPKDLARPVEKSIQDDYTKLRVNNFGKVLSCVSTLFQQYSSVLMSLDVCGSEIYSRYYGGGQTEEHSNMMRDAQENKKPAISGCRHSMGFSSKTHGYEANHCIFLRLLLKQSLGNWELITKEMCYRINNTYTLLMLLPFIQNKMAECLDINLEPLLHALDGGQAASNVYSAQGPSGSSVTYPQAQQLSFELQPCRDFLESIIQIQMKLLISRVMDIFHKLFDHLYSMQLRYKKIQEQMSPCLKYLSQQMKFFQHTLYVDCLREVTIAIWKTVIDKYHDVLRKLHEPGDDPQKKGKELYVLLTSQYLMIRESLNLDPQDDGLMLRIYEESRLIFFRLQVFLMNTKDLIALYNYLESSMQIRDIIENRDQCLTVEECYYHVMKMLTNKSKSFTGTNFIRRIVDNRKVLDGYTRNPYQKTMTEGQQEKSRHQRAEIIAKYYVQSGWIICRKENHAEHRPQIKGSQVILQLDDTMKSGRTIDGYFVENDDIAEDDDEPSSDDQQRTQRSHSDDINAGQQTNKNTGRSADSAKPNYFTKGSMFTSWMSNTSCISNASVSNASNEESSSADWTTGGGGCVHARPQSQSYWNVDKEEFHINGIYVFNMTEENRPVELAGKLYDIMRYRSDRQIILADIRKDIRSILGYICKTKGNRAARQFFRTHGLRNPYLRSYSCFW